MNFVLADKMDRISFIVFQVVDIIAPQALVNHGFSFYKTVIFAQINRISSTVHNICGPRIKCGAVNDHIIGLPIGETSDAAAGIYHGIPGGIPVIGTHVYFIIGINDVGSIKLFVIGLIADDIIGFTINEAADALPAAVAVNNGIAGYIPVANIQVDAFLSGCIINISGEIDVALLEDDIV